MATPGSNVREAFLILIIADDKPALLVELSGQDERGDSVRREETVGGEVFRLDESSVSDIQPFFQSRVTQDQRKRVAELPCQELHVSEKDRS